MWCCRQNFLMSWKMKASNEDLRSDCFPWSLCTPRPSPNLFHQKHDKLVAGHISPKCLPRCILVSKALPCPLNVLSATCRKCKSMVCLPLSLVLYSAICFIESDVTNNILCRHNHNPHSSSKCCHHFKMCKRICAVRDIRERCTA